MPDVPRRHSRTPGRAAAVLAAVVLALLGAGTPDARAHDALVATAPAADATLPAAPATVELELSAPPQALGTQVAVTAADGTLVSRGPAAARDRTVVQPLADGLAGGAYTVAWRTVSADGHPLSGTFVFSVAAGAGSAEDTAAPPPDPGTAAAQPAGPPAGGGWVAAGAAGLVVLAAAVVVSRLRRWT